MCTLVVLRRPDHRWPLLLAANRDEMAARPWLPPARHWPERPHVIAGLDLLGGGSWFGLNDDGVAAGVMNREGSLGPAPGRRSRGELVLAALDYRSAAAAADALAGREANVYRSFNLVVADHREAFWLRHLGEQGPGWFEVSELPRGVSMIAAHDLNDPSSPRIRDYLPRFRTANAPDPEAGDWSAWAALLASRECDAQAGPRGAMTVVTDSGFGTVSSVLLALPSPGKAAPHLRFAAGRSDQAPFEEIPL